MITAEILLRLVLTLIVILTPLIWICFKLRPFLAQGLNKLRDLSLPSFHRDTTQETSPSPDTPKVTKRPSPSKLIDTAKKGKEPNKKVAPPTPSVNEDVEEKEKLSARDQKKLESIKYAALSHRERGKLDQYEKNLVEGLAIDKDNLEFLELLGEHYFKTGNFIKAMTILKKVINLDPDNHKAIRQIGQIYLSQGEQDTAKILIEKSLALKPDNPKYHISMVEIYYEQSNIKKAIISMQKILKLRPSNIDYLLTIATLHEEAGEPTKATEYFSKIIELDPMNENAKKGIKRLSF